MSRLGFCCALVLCAGISLLQGCGKGGLEGPTGTVSGTVTIGGKPLSDASITFFGESNGDTATAVLGSDGAYSLKYEGGFSVPAGDYRVAVIAGPPPGEKAPDPADLMKTMKPQGLGKSPIPPKYRDPKTSALVAVVKEGSNPNISFDLK